MNNYMYNVAEWIWYGNDFELFSYHKMVKRRTLRKNLIYPTWAMDRPEYQVTFRYEYDIPEDTTIRIHHSGIISVMINENPYYTKDSDGDILIDKGKGVILVYCMSENDFPTIFIQNKYIKTNENWTAYCVDNNIISVSCNGMFLTEDDSPVQYHLPVKRMDYLTEKKVGKGKVYDFGRELVGTVVLKSNTDKEYDLFYGESETEAVDYEYSEVIESISAKAGTPSCGGCSMGFRYVFISDTADLTEFYVNEEIYPVVQKAEFNSSDKMLKDIYDTACYTLALTSREFFIDGIKRDRWVWAGDTLQSMLFDFYTFNDRDIIKRTLRALIGKQPIRSNINGILDYNFYYIISVFEYYKFTGDKEFLKEIYPRLESLMAFIFTKPKKDGFLMSKNEWIFIDWTDIPFFCETNISYPIALIQILYYTSLRIMIDISDVLGIKCPEKYLSEISGLKERINQVFFDSEKGFYHDTAHKLNTKYANIFAVLLGFASREQKEIIGKALTDGSAYEIYTPFMKFFELCALAETERMDYVMEYMKFYWGGMISEGATTFWERYVPEEKGNEKYAMYNKKYGKSLCHSWGAGPVYIIGKYLAGVSPISVGYDEYMLKPFSDKYLFSIKVPVNNSFIDVSYDGKKLKVYCKDINGYIKQNKNIVIDGLEYSEENHGYILKKGVEYSFNVKKGEGND